MSASHPPSPSELSIDPVAPSLSLPEQLQALAQLALPASLNSCSTVHSLDGPSWPRQFDNTPVDPLLDPLRAEEDIPPGALVQWLEEIQKIGSISVSAAPTSAGGHDISITLRHDPSNPKGSRLVIGALFGRELLCRSLHFYAAIPGVTHKGILPAQKTANGTRFLGMSEDEELNQATKPSLKAQQAAGVIAAVLATIENVQSGQPPADPMS